jgi:hypothetical protein
MQSVMVLVLRLLKFLSFCAIAYLVVLFAAANGGEGIKTFMRRHTNIPAGIKARGDTVRRLQDLSRMHDVDILFVGSSHCYRAFDPRIFAEQGLTSFNMGSAVQSPVNSFFLLRPHIARLKPRLIIFESYWAIFRIDGAESFLDLSAAMPPGRELARMAWATGSPLAWNGFLIRALELRRNLGEGAAMPILAEERYVGDGFVERIPGPAVPYLAPDPSNVKIEPEQLRYLRELLRIAREAGARALVVVQPMPAATVDSFLNRDKINQTLSALALSEGAEFLDFNQYMSLDGPEYFYDSDHLTQKGVEAFDRRLLQELKQRRLLPSPRN